MIRKIATSSKTATRGLRKTPAKNPKRSRTAATATTRPPPPGEGKRGEQGYLAYLLRQAQAATRLTMERSLADLGVTQHVIDCQLGGRRDGLMELRRFGTQIVSKLA